MSGEKDEMISFDEAANIARQLKGHYKAFVKLESVLQLAAGAEQRVTEKTRQGDKLVEDIKKLSVEKATLEASLPAAREAKEKAEGNLASRKDELEKEYGGARQTIKRAHTELLEELKKMEATAREEYGRKMVELEEMEKDLQGRVNSLQGSLDSLIKKAKDVGAGG